MIKIYFDLETTGTNPNLHSIHQIAGLVEINGVLQDSFDFKVRPHERAEFDPYALQMANKSKEDLVAYPPMKVIYKTLTGLLDKYINRYDSKDKAFLIGFNNRNFDDLFLRKFFELCGSSFFGSYFWPHSIDVSVLATQYLLYRRRSMPSFKLHRVASELGLLFEKEDLHDAVADVTLTRDIYLIVSGLEPEL